MPTYLTRHLVAKRPFRHEGRELTAGDHFEATENDARYLLQNNDADAHQPQGATDAPAPAPAPAPAAAKHTPPEDFDAQTGPVTPGNANVPTNTGGAVVGASENTPPADDAHVAVGAERFSDGKPQTEESLAAAQGHDTPSIAPGIDGLHGAAAAGETGPVGISGPGPHPDGADGAKPADDAKPAGDETATVPAALSTHDVDQQPAAPRGRSTGRRGPAPRNN